ncbi:MAG: hypothetical protein IGS48_18065 [Oscillatoriales cyanobacterium C42_A2020_001]|nr:hypothetical protein [Leptolyngbyaceae cyanobacterium C42_A2020_001]
MSYQSTQIDPLDSPHPIPWSWVLATINASHSSSLSGTYCYRSQSLISPDREYAAYSRIQMQVESEYFRSHVTSVLFLENLRTGDLQAITPKSPLADNPFLNTGTDLAGRISIVIPVSWSESGDRLLAREFESLFGSDIASDYAVIADRQRNRVYTITPTRIRYTNAVLLGWSQLNPDKVLFRAGMMGDEHWQQWTVDMNGNTALARGDRTVLFGQAINSIWTGPQMQNQQ